MILVMGVNFGTLLKINHRVLLLPFSLRSLQPYVPQKYKRDLCIGILLLFWPLINT